MKRDSFGTRLGLIAATAGSAVGLGNIWRFPSELGEQGGAAFLFVYLGFVLLLGLPVVFAELIIGRRAGCSVFGAFRKLSGGKFWAYIGALFVLSALLIISYYLSISAWILDYLWGSVSGAFKGQTSDSIGLYFDAASKGSWRPMIGFVVFLLLNAWILLGGIQKGIEKYSKLLMPILLLLLIVLAIRSCLLPGATEGLGFLFRADFEKLTGRVVLNAMGQAFFSLSVGMGVLITYGSYVKRDTNLGSVASSVVCVDTMIAILAAIVIFPAAYAFGINVEEGPTLVFNTIPLLFGEMQGGYFFTILFFALLVVAALTSTISILEVIVSFVQEEFQWTRRKATLSALSVVFVTGTACTLSSYIKDDLAWVSFSFFDVFDTFSANYLLGLGSLLVVLFGGWWLGKSKWQEEFSNTVFSKAMMNILLFILRYFAPLAIVIIFLINVNST